MIDTDPRPIGVFDSGIGGLTVLAAIHKILPWENTIYLGDTARVPYGTKSPEVVTRYALNNAAFLEKKGIKLLVVACNTASALALPALQKALDIPVLGVIEAGARRALELSDSKLVGVVGTEGTIASGAYKNSLASLDTRVKVFSKACPLFVPLAEEGWGDHPVAVQVAKEYLKQWTEEKGMDSLILGCTHYPLLVPAISRALGSEIRLIDSATAVAEAVLELLGNKRKEHDSQKAPKGYHRYFVTDVPDRFSRVGQRFLGAPLGKIQQVDLVIP